MIKTNAAGDTQWKVTPSEIQKPANFTLTDVRQTSDGGYILAGEENNVSGNNYTGAGCLIKLSDNGVPEWNRTYYGVSPTRVEQTADGGFILTGGGAISLFKTDSTGNPQWNKTYSGEETTFIHQTADGGYVVAGRDSGGNLLLLKTDSAGNKLWSYNYSHPSTYDTCVSTIATADGGYAMAAVNDNGLNLVLVKIAGNGTLLWQKSYAGNWDITWWLFGQDCDIQQTADGGYIILGKTTSLAPVLLKVDANGTMQWAKRDYQGVTVWQGSLSTGGGAFSVVQSSDGGYAFAGVSLNGVIFIVKLAANPTYAPPSILFVSLFDAAGLELVAIVVLVVVVVKGKDRHEIPHAHEVQCLECGVVWSPPKKGESLRCPVCGASFERDRYRKLYEGKR
jgi:predicted RNA-binding Zn-ribbon protein involved in translation (DUF1610 family)